MEIREPDRKLVELTCLIVEQNSKILEMNAALLKLFSAPKIIVEREEKD